MLDNFATTANIHKVDNFFGTARKGATILDFCFFKHFISDKPLHCKVGMDTMDKNNIKNNYVYCFIYLFILFTSWFFLSQSMLCSITIEQYSQLNSIRCILP